MAVVRARLVIRVFDLMVPLRPPSCSAGSIGLGVQENDGRAAGRLAIYSFRSLIIRILFRRRFPTTSLVKLDINFKVQ